MKLEVVFLMSFMFLYLHILASNVKNVLFPEIHKKTSKKGGL